MTPEEERERASARGEAPPEESTGGVEAEDATAEPAAATDEPSVTKEAPGGANGAAVGANGDGAADRTAGAGAAGDGGRDGGESAGADGDRDDAGADESSPESRLAAAEALAAAHWDRLVRLQAEMENQRKRAQRDVANARKFALEGIAEDLLPVKDSLELGIRAASGEEAGPASLLEGSELTLKMLAQVLEKHAIVEIDPEGEKFDPEFHQAMSMQAVEGVAPNTVTGVMQKGYTLNERLIRPALVMVSK